MLTLMARSRPLNSFAFVIYIVDHLRPLFSISLQICGTSATKDSQTDQSPFPPHISPSTSRTRFDSLMLLPNFP
jgi:hypothetical protein